MAQVGSIRGLSVCRLPDCASLVLVPAIRKCASLIRRIVPVLAHCSLQKYIKKIRAASTQQERESIVQQELAKIRQKYSSTKKCSGAFQQHPRVLVFLKCW
jgi:hypothetical protein